MDSPSKFVERRDGQTVHPELAILMHCHNEAETLGAFIRRLKRFSPQKGWLIADNGSTDGSQ